MSDESISQQIASSNEPRKWIAAIIGGVILGEALWSMLQILVRDWATPAIQNALGQGPTQNQAAFEPLPLVIAFVEACLAAILLLLLMSLAQRRVRVVVRTVRASNAAQFAPATGSVVQAPIPATSVTVPAASTARVEPVAVPAVSAPANQRPATPAATSPRPIQPQSGLTPIESTPIATPAEPLAAQISTSAPAVTPRPPASPAPPPSPAVAAKPVPAKKPKAIYYNSVGEPIED